MRMRHLAVGGAGSKMFVLKCHRSFAFVLLENLDTQQISASNYSPQC
jgi:hypothetical protein